ncbi:hypothetical protein [Flavobacterium sp. I3-2]|uniref:hypothetical protein n=1 Tax=Flavobacterium sp. I3-2 TaxID=2748319 RepID=UPI0015B1FC15|nr:hypothetical protein [Flavobacterium sp. I3-2]
MEIKKTELSEFIRVKGQNVHVGTFIASGKDGDYFVVVSPSILVSGYGDTEEEADNSFKENLILFCQDILRLSSEKREEYLYSLGFSKEKFKNKNFSKLFVDSDGILQGLDKGTAKTSFIEATEVVA